MEVRKMEKTGTQINSILYVINPGSGSGIPENFEEMVDQYSLRNKYEYRIFKTDRDGEQKKLGSLIDEMGPTIVAACGGDGTVNLVARHLLKKNIKMAIVPLGSSNGMAFELGIPQEPEEALKLIFSGKSRKIDLIKINDDHICLHLADLGMNARVVKYFQREKTRGLFGYAKHYFRELGKAEKFRCRIQKNGRPVFSKVIMVVIANASFYGTGAAINPQGKLDDGKFEIVLIRYNPFWFIIQMLLTFITGGMKKNKWIRIVSVSKASVFVSPAQELQVDGEPAGKSDQIQIEAMHRQIEVIIQ
jgi:YegS/Rv2252/BmrU family lipid kinase